MAKRWRVKPNKNLRDNARLVLPMMIDNFLARNDRVVSHPRLKLELHRMRLTGKTVRYAMEVFEPAFDEKFETCLQEFKHLLDTMGKIHDCDVNAPRLQSHLREMRLFNRATPNRDDRVSTGSIVKLIREQLATRRSLFEDMCSILGRWRRENFKGKVLQSMMVPL